jgi:hypothetical protein
MLSLCAVLVDMACESWFDCPESLYTVRCGVRELAMPARVDFAWAIISTTNLSVHDDCEGISALCHNLLARIKHLLTRRKYNGVQSQFLLS